MYGPLNDPHFFLLVLSCAAVITIGSLVTALNRIPRAKFARLQNEQLSKLQDEVEQLSEKIKALEAAEERRFLTDLNKRKRNGAEPLGSIPSINTASDAPPLVTDAGTTDLAALAHGACTPRWPQYCSGFNVLLPETSRGVTGCLGRQLEHTSCAGTLVIADQRFRAIVGQQRRN